MTERMTQEQDGVVVVPLEEEERPASGLLRGVLEVVQALAIAVLISVGLNLFVVQVTEVRQRSMEDTLDHGDRVLVSKVDYRLHPPQRSDIVVFRPPIDANIPFVKRVVAIAGDTVEIRDGRVLVNDVEVSEPYVIGSTQARAIRYPYVVPAGSVFVMGDNRPVSGDSREWGAVRDEEIIGKVVIRFWPLGKMHFFDW
jgi:signal peptidase I